MRTFYRKFTFSMKNIPQKEGKKQPKIKTEMNGKGLTVHAGLLPVLPFMEKLLFRKRVQEAVRKERGTNAQYQIVDAMQMDRDNYHFVVNDRKEEPVIPIGRKQKPHHLPNSFVSKIKFGIVPKSICPSDRTALIKNKTWLCSNAPMDLTAFHVPMPLNALNQDKRRRPTRFR